MKRHRTVCVLGGSGFIGTRLVSALAADGRHVRVPSRRPERNRTLAVLPTVRMERVDVHDAAALARVFAGCDAVINLVGVLHESRRETFRKVHVELPRKVAQACKASGVRRLLHVSALNADAAAAPSAYLRTKGEGEAALRVHAGGDVAWTVFQPSLVFGPGDTLLNRFAGLLRLAPLVFPLARAGVRLQPVFVGDVADALVRALDDPATVGTRFTLCGPRVYTLRELVTYVRDVLGLRTRVVALPDAIGWIQAAALELVPGKPFSRDAFRSLTADAVCGGGPGLDRFGIAATAMEVVAPRYLAR